MKHDTFHNMDSEKRLTLLLKKGNEHAFRQIYEEYADMIYHFAYRMTNSPEVAEEIVQDTFLRLWKYQTDIQINRSLKAYLKQICRNQIFRYYKLEAQRQAVSLEVSRALPTSANTSEDQFVFREYYQLAQQAINQLPPRRKQIFNLCYEQGKTYEQAASELNIARSTVHDHMVKSIRSIKKHVQMAGRTAFSVFLSLAGSLLIP